MRKVLSVVPLIAALVVPGVARAQSTREITGRVVQSPSGTPLLDATVGIIGAPGGVRTNANGEYRLTVPNGDVTVLARSIGTAWLLTFFGAGIPAAALYLFLHAVTPV